MKPMLWLAAAMLLGIMLIGNCDDDRQQVRKDVDGVTGSMIFFRESRSGLCFALVRPEGGRKAPLLTQVPCESVLHLLVK